jgi:hypothetical protein
MTCKLPNMNVFTEKTNDSEYIMQESRWITGQTIRMNGG